MVFQDPLSALDPVQTVGDQIAEVPRRVLGVSRSARSRERASSCLGSSASPIPPRRASAYPHQLSGGMRQRVVIAIALADRAVGAALRRADHRARRHGPGPGARPARRAAHAPGLALVFVSHDLAVVRQLCEHVAVMYTGRLVETGPTELLLEPSRIIRTRYGLLDAIVDLDDPVARCSRSPARCPISTRLPRGCTFHPRCPLATAECVDAFPHSSPSPPRTRIVPSPASTPTSSCAHEQRGASAPSDPERAPRASRSTT